MTTTSARPLTVLQLISSLEIGGSERLLVALLDSARADPSVRHVAVVMNDEVEPRQWAALQATGAAAIRLDRPRGRRHPRYLLSLLGILRRERPAIIHTHNEGSRAWGMLLKLASPGVRLVHTVHAHGTLDAIGPWYRRLIDLSVDRQIAIAPGIAAEIATTGLSRVATITNGIDIARFDRPRRARAPGEPLRVVCVGRFDPPVKGQDVLIDALGRLHAAGVDLRLTLAGQSRPAVEASLTAQAQERGVADRLRFERDRLDVEAILAEHDIFVLPSRSEGFGLALVEAMAAGLPVVATRTGGPATLIEEGVNGLLAPPGDAAALAAAIGRLAGDAELASALAEAGRRAAAEHGIAAMRTRYHDLYRDLVGAAHAAPSRPVWAGDAPEVPR